VIEISERLSIPESELCFSASRSSGPGGQHVNKVSSRVTLEFHVLDSPSLDAAQKRRICRRLPTRVTKDGRLKLHCQRWRSQAANRRELIARFRTLLQDALRRRRPRRKTRRPPAAEERRLREKSQRSRAKRDRAWRPSEKD
jgi:ribosome-associated protein